MKRSALMVLAIFAASATLAHAEPKVDFERAKATAQHKVPKGTLTSHDLVREHGHLVYSFLFVEPGKSGTREVDVDAASGKVMKVKHESVEAAQKAKAKEEKQQFQH